MGRTVIIIFCIVTLLVVSGVAIAKYKGICSAETRIDWMMNRSDLIEAFADFSDNLEQHQRDKLQVLINMHRQHRSCEFNCDRDLVEIQQ